MGDPLQALAEAVSLGVQADAIESSTTLTRLRIPHALIGGLAVGIHGHPRATKDVDYLVGPEAFVRKTPILEFREELGGIVQIGVIDFMPVSERYGACSVSADPGARRHPDHCRRGADSA